MGCGVVVVFFFNDPAPTEIYTLALHDSLPIFYTNGSGPELKFAGAAYVAGEFGSWSPFAAVQTASGYDVAWKNASSGTYTVRRTTTPLNSTPQIISNSAVSLN